MNQTMRVLEYMTKQPHINKFRAQGELHVNDLRKVISNIRAMGYEVVKSVSTNYLQQEYTNYGLSPKDLERAKEVVAKARDKADKNAKN